MRRKPVPLTKEGKTGERIDTNTFVASAVHQVSFHIKERQNRPGVDFINCFTHYADPSRLAPHFYTTKSFSKPGRRVQKLGVGHKPVHEIETQ